MGVILSFFVGFVYGLIFINNPVTAGVILSFLGHIFGTAIVLLLMIVFIVYIYETFSR